MAGKSDIVDRMQNEVSGLTRRQASEALDAILDSIGDYLANGERVQFIGFGSFEVREAAGRVGSNPKTGETITIPATRRVRFRTGINLKEKIND